jgi:hypothetical protein
MQSGTSAETSAMARVQEGMRVVDAAGQEIGKVEYVKMGDPEAVTTEGNQDRPTDLLGRITENALDEESEPDVAGPLREKLRRTGFLKIGGHGLLGTDRYVSSERVGQVSGDVVRLTVRQDELAKED